MSRDAKFLHPADYVFDTLSERILSGQYGPGTLAPPQRALAQELGVSRGYVRQALERLAEKGLVKLLHGKGTQILPASERARKARIAFVRGPVHSWLTQEDTLLAEGVARRLAASGHVFDTIGFRHPGGRGAGLSPPGFVELAEVPALVEPYDAVIVAEISEATLASLVQKLEESRRPVAVANLEVDLPVTGATLDHYGIRRRAVEMLVSLGHRRIGYAGRRPGAFFYGKAFEGFRDGLAAAGLEVDESLAVFSERTNPLDAYLAARPLFRRSDPPTAVVAARDVYAHGVCQAAHEAGLRAGYDVSVIGFDDMSWVDGRRFLTTYSEPCMDMGAAAVDMLLDRLYNGWRPPEQRTLEAPLVLRRSAGPAPAGPPERRSSPVDTAFRPD